jgi:hypothetical protein
MRKSAIAVAAVALCLTGLTACATKSKTDSTSTSSASTSGSSTTNTAVTGPLGQGVSADAIKVGVAYVDFSALKGVMNIDQGDFKTAYKAVIDQVNADGGINGRKLEASFAPINPLGNASADAACTKFAQDDRVFVTIGFFYGQTPACYLITHGVNMIGQPATGADLSADQQKQFKATWFSYRSTPAHSVTAVVDAFKSANAFEGERVAVVSEGLDGSTASSYVSELKAAGVDVVDDASQSSSPTDLNAYYKEYKLIAQQFKSKGATAVFTVGAGASGGWPKYLQASKSTYLPRLLAADYSGVQSWQPTAGADANKILKDSVAVAPYLSDIDAWKDPAFQKCVGVINAANPSTKVFEPTAENLYKQPAPWASAEQACANVDLLRQILKAAGPTVNNDTFKTAGESLKNITVIGSATAGPITFSPERHDGVSPLVLYTWDESATDYTSKVLS